MRESIVKLGMHNFLSQDLILRNQVNRERKACRARYYVAKVKKLGRMTPLTPRALFLQHLDCGPQNPSPELVDIANTISQTFLAPYSWRFHAFSPGKHIRSDVTVYL